MKFLFFSCLILAGTFSLHPAKAFSQDSLIVSVEVPKASFLTTDPSGNVYIISDQHTLLRFDENGKPTGYYNNLQNGFLGWIDADNPLKILLFYPQFEKILILDKMLSPKAQFNLHKLNLFDVTACGISEDNNIWVYDNTNAQLYKLGNDMSKLVMSNDLRTETGTVPHPASLVANRGIVYLPDTLQGIYTLDRYGNYLNTLAIKGVHQLQIVNEQLIWISEGKLYSYNQKSFEEKKITLPPNAISAQISRGRLYVLFPDKLMIYYIVKH